MRETLMLELWELWELDIRFKLNENNNDFQKNLEKHF